MDLPEEKPVSNAQSPLPQRLLANNNTPSKTLMAFGVSLLLVAALALVFGQRIGYNRGLSYAAEQAKKLAEGQEISASNVKALKLKSDTLQSQLTTAQQERDISLSTLAELRESTQELKVTNLQLGQGQEFFVKALAKKGGLPLQVIGVKIVPLPENAYEYRFDVGMVDPSGQEKMLIPKLTLLDDVNMVEVPLQPSSYSINGIARIRGRFIMPKDFLPKQIKLELSAGNQKAEHSYEWELGQPVDDMPYSLEETPEADERPVTDGDVASTPITAAPSSDSLKNPPKLAVNKQSVSATSALPKSAKPTSTEPKQATEGAQTQKVSKTLIPANADDVKSSTKASDDKQPNEKSAN